VLQRQLPPQLLSTVADGSIVGDEIHPWNPWNPWPKRKNWAKCQVFRKKKHWGTHHPFNHCWMGKKTPKFQIRSVFLRYKTMVFLTASKVHPGRRPFQPMIRDLHQANTCYSLKSRNRHAFFEKAMVGISRELNLQIVSKGIGLGYQWTHKRLVID